MKIEYQARTGGGNPLGIWSADLELIRKSYRKSVNTLHRRECETPEEAAVRRMNWLEMRCKETKTMPSVERIVFVPCGSSVSAEIDRKCPPPPVEEVQVDWDTLEPVEEVPVWQTQWGKWIAGIAKEDWKIEADSGRYIYLCSGNVAIGHTRESALRNLAELKGQR